MNGKLLDYNNRDEFINNNKSFIYKVAQNICKRHLNWENDDELSVSLIAFNKACDTYSKEKGDFFSFSKIIIKNSLIDFFRKNSKSPYLIFDEEDNKLEYIDAQLSLSKYNIEKETAVRAEEIKLLSKELALYKLDFNILINSSPSHKDTRDTLLNIAFKCIREERILNSIKSKKLLPVKEIMLLTGHNKKLIDKWRRYILALIIILSSNEYPYIKSYLNIKAGDNND